MTESEHGSFLAKHYVQRSRPLGRNPFDSGGEARALWRRLILDSRRLVSSGCRDLWVGARRNRPNINGALLLFVAWLSQLIGSPIFSIDGFNSEGLAISSLGWAILASVILYIVSYIGRTIFKKAYGR